MKSQTAARARARLREFIQPEKAPLLASYFKTGPGEYGEGDRFLGVMVPNTRKVAKEFGDLSQSEVRTLLASQWHEERLLGFLILSRQFEKGDLAEKKKVFDFYIRSKAFVNNWDLVDVIAPKIVGQWLVDKPRSLLYRWVRSSRLWDRRLAVISTFAFIREGDVTDSLKMAELLLSDPEDLMHKATGWMLREVGIRDEAVLCRFLDRFATKMPRTMLRYSIERLPKTRREKYLRQKGPKRWNAGKNETQRRHSRLQ